MMRCDVPRTNSTVTTTTARMAAKPTEYFGLNHGGKTAVIANS